MFHSQLVGGTSIQFKTIGDMTYTVTPQDIGKTLKFGQNAIITVGSLNVVEGSLFTTENITGIEGSPTIVLLNDTDLGNFKRIVWNNQTTYDVQFAAYDISTEWFHFYFMLDMPSDNENYNNDIHILITIGSDIVVDYYFNSHRIKYQIWDYSCGQIRAISMRQTNSTTPQNRPNPVFSDRITTASIDNIVNNITLNYSSYDRITIVPNEEITSAGVSLLNITRGQILQHIFQNGMYIEIDATTYGVSGLIVDGVPCPSVPQGEVHKFIFYPYHGGFSRIG